jgi:S-adenosyl methyltransferase
MTSGFGASCILPVWELTFDKSNLARQSLGQERMSSWRVFRAKFWPNHVLSLGSATRSTRLRGGRAQKAQRSVAGRRCELHRKVNGGYPTFPFLSAISIFCREEAPPKVGGGYSDRRRVRLDGARVRFGRHRHEQASSCAHVRLLPGGKDNYAVDQEAAREILQAVPEVRDMARENRAFLQRAVRFLVGEAGIRQITDIGTGIPAAGNVHEVAREMAPDVRVIYVDNDPIVHVHASALLTGTGSTRIVLADLREPETILGHPKVRELIDFRQPVAVLLVAILHFITDDENPERIVAAFRDALPLGSYLRCRTGPLNSTRRTLSATARRCTSGQPPHSCCGATRRSPLSSTGSTW